VSKRKRKAAAPERMPGVADLFPSRRPPPTLIVREVQERLREQITEGTRCPCCRQHVKLYCRKLNTTMARGLLWLCGESGPKLHWVDCSDKAPRWLVSKGGTLATLAHWQLIEGLENEDKKKRSSGIWRPTERGWAFAHDQIAVASHVFLYNNRAVAFSEEVIRIIHALGDGFDYEQLMQPTSLERTRKKQTTLAL